MAKLTHSDLYRYLADRALGVPAIVCYLGAKGRRGEAAEIAHAMCLRRLDKR